MDYQSQNPTTNPWKNASIIWGIVALVLSIIMVTFNNASMVLAAGFFSKTLAVLVGTLLGLAGALIGEAIRQFTLPDGFFTTGGMGSIIKTKLFWAIGPQSIGTLIGVAIGIALVLK